MAATSVTPTDVRNESLAGIFADISDANIQKFIDRAAKFFGSPAVLAHNQREDAVTLLAAHLLYLRLVKEGVIGGGGGGSGGGALISSLSLVGVGSMSFAVSAQSADELNDWLKATSPFATDLHAIIDTFPPTIFVTGMTGDEVY